MKKLFSFMLCLLLLAPAGAFASEAEPVWRDSSEEEITALLGLQFGRAGEMEEISFQISDSAAQMQFTLNSVPYTARIKPTDGFEDISDYADVSWSISAGCTVGWCEAKAMMTQIDGEILALCLWYDAAPGLMYSVSADTDELKGLDIQRAAEAVFAPMQNDADGITAEEVHAALVGCTGYAGTAGSSLKNAIAACRLAAFADEKQIADLDPALLCETIMNALSGLTDEQGEELSFNLESIHSALTEAFTDYESICGLFEDAGAEEEILLLLAEPRAYEHYLALYDQLCAAGL